MTEILCMHVQHFQRIGKQFKISYTKFKQWLTREHIKNFSHLMKMSTFEIPHPKHGTNIVPETLLLFFLLWLKCCLLPHLEVLNYMSVVYLLRIAPAWFLQFSSFMFFMSPKEYVGLWWSKPTCSLCLYLLGVLISQWTVGDLSF